MDKLEIIAIVSVIIILLIWYFSGEKTEGFVGVLRSDYSVSIPMSDKSMAPNAGTKYVNADRDFRHLNTPTGKLTAEYLNRSKLRALVDLIEPNIPRMRTWMARTISKEENEEYRQKTGRLLPVRKNVDYVFSHPYDAFIYNGPMSYGAILISFGFYEKMLNDMKRALSKLDAEYDSCSTNNCRDIVNKKTIFMRYYFHTGTLISHAGYYIGGHTMA